MVDCLLNAIGLGDWSTIGDWLLFGAFLNHMLKAEVGEVLGELVVEAVSTVDPGEGISLMELRALVLSYGGYLVLIGALLSKGG